MKRRHFLLASAAGAVSAPLLTLNAANAAEGDGTPMQFMPKTPKDSDPLQDEFAKYPKCPYCGMDRQQFHFSRHLIHYGDDLVDGTCSLRCAAVSLSLNLDRVPTAIYAADNAAAGAVKPLVEISGAAYVIGGDHKAVMSRTAKTAFGSVQAAEAAKGSGEVADFDRALELAYLDMAEDTKMIRQRRAEKRKAGGHGGHGAGQ